MFRDSITQSPGSLFKSSAIPAVQQPEEHSKSLLPMEQSFNASTKTLQFTELGNIATYVRLDHVRNPEQTSKARKWSHDLQQLKVILSRPFMWDKCDVFSNAASFHNR